MSTLYVATSPEALADKLAANIDQQQRAGDIFTATQIVVPNPYLGKWLRLRLARQHGVAINLQFGYLESTLWNMLRAVDPRDHDIEPELLDGDIYRLLVLSVLLGEDEPNLAGLRHYFKGEDDPQSRRSWRRAWHLADKLGNLIRDYEYHRQDALIQPWINNELVIGRSGEPTPRRSPLQEFEKGQYAVFDHIIRLKVGKRSQLNEKAGKNYKTLPQYAMEVLEVLHAKPRGEYSNPAGLPVGSTLHLFGLSQISALHVHTLRWLGACFDLRLYHLNPLASRLSSQHAPCDEIHAVADRFRIRNDPEAGGIKSRHSPEDELLRVWGCAGAESLWLMGQLFVAGTLRVPSAKRWTIETLPTKKNGTRSVPTTNVLGRLQQNLLGQTSDEPKLAQDTSLQIVGCPGAMREVETVLHSILHNMQTNPALRLTDIAVLVTDMNKYRPIIQAVFDRPQPRVGYNLMDYPAAAVSTFGQGFLGMLDLALESFTRSRVLEVLENPCFLARLGVERAQAHNWVIWAKELGVFQGWDAAEKKERGYAASSLFGWQLGLRRLRLGKFMDTEPASLGEPAPRFDTILPFADLDSQDRAQLDAFSRAVDGMLPTLAKLRGKKLSGTAWADALRQLIANFLAVPEDRPEEGAVRERMLEILDLLPLWDHLQPTPLPLPLIREFIHDHLEAIEGRHGDHLTGGVTIAPLAALGPIPFSIIYVVGLGEDQFPGSNTLPSFDLRSAARLPGDIHPAEKARYLFLEALLAARDKIYLLWNNKDLQKDQNLLPAIPIVQLQRYLNRQVLEKEFAVAKMTLHDRAPNSLKPDPTATCHDVGRWVNETERLVALTQAGGSVVLDKKQMAEIEKRKRDRLPDFALPAAQDASSAVQAVTIKDLKAFLENPALASLRRHLHLKDDLEDEESQDEEPFVRPFLTQVRLTTQVVQKIIHDTTKVSLAEALSAWPSYFERMYEDEKLRCRAPDGDFGKADQAHLQAELQSRVTNALAEFLKERDPKNFCGPLLLGASATPIGAKRRFPALSLYLPSTAPAGAPTQVTLNGQQPFVWANGKNLDILVLSHKEKIKSPKTLSKTLFEPVLFYLALLANDASFPGEVSSQSWLRGSVLNVHLFTKEKCEQYAYMFSESEAAAYLSDLVADYLNAAAFDLMPFEVIAGEGKKEDDLSAAYVLPADQACALAESYCERLSEKIEDALEGSQVPRWYAPLLELAKAKVPDDAFDKVGKRFRLLDRGPAQHRKK